MRIVVNTPAGHIGSVVAEKALGVGDQLVLISRNPEKIARYVERGARLVEGPIDDPDVLDRAVGGADALFWLTPFAFDKPDYLNWARRTGQIAAGVARKHGLNRVVIISSIGAQNDSGVGPVACLPAIEQSFRDAVPNVASLRAGSFMENFLNYVGTIAATGTIFGAYPAGKKIPMVATRDIGDKAFEMLHDSGWSGFRIVGVHGPEDLDQIEAAKIISEGIGRPVRYVEVTIEQAKQGMIGAGIPAHVADLLGEMYQGFREGRMQPAEPRTPETTTPTTLREFSREILKPAVEAASAR